MPSVPLIPMDWKRQSSAPHQPRKQLRELSREKPTSCAVGCSSPHRHRCPPPLPSSATVAQSLLEVEPGVGFEVTDFPFPPRFACHLRARSSGLSGDDTISLGTVRPRPPTPGMCRYSGIQMEPGYLPPPPSRVEGRTLLPDILQGLRLAPVGTSAPSLSSPPSTGESRPHAHRSHTINR